MIETSKKYLSKFWQPLLLLTLILLGFISYFLGLFDLGKILTVAQDYAQYWWPPVVLIAVQVLLYTLALPGSLVFWVLALIYEPVTATLILVTGSTLGALTAYWFARQESLMWVSYIQRSRFFHLLEKRGDFLTLSALRIMPGFPHSVINYGSGILRLPLGQFLVSTLIGVTLKNFLYTSAVYGAVTAADPSELIRIETIGPLILVALLFTLAALFRNYLSSIHHEH